MEAGTLNPGMWKTIMDRLNMSALPKSKVVPDTHPTEDLLQMPVVKHGASLQSPDFEAIPPVQGYTPQQDKKDYSLSAGQMMDRIHQDSPNFSDWMNNGGGFHLDKDQGGFVPDVPEKSFMDKLKETPQNALNSMADYEKVNPLGSALGFMGNVVAGQTARGFKQAETLGRVFGGAVDALPRFELADNLAKVHELPKFLQEKNLDDVLDHPELFNNYPDMRNVKVQKMMPTMENYGKGGGFHVDENGNTVLRVNGNQSPDAIKSSLLHEVQHEIQRREGFSQGTKGEAADYMQNAGEREARTVQDRIPMTDADRQASPFNSMQHRTYPQIADLLDRLRS